MQAETNPRSMSRVYVNSKSFYDEASVFHLKFDVSELYCDKMNHVLVYKYCYDKCVAFKFCSKN